MTIIRKGSWQSSTIKIPKFSSIVPLGFPSPADDYIESSLDLTELLIKHPASTYIAEARGDSMVGVGIFSGDLLIVDRSVQATHKAVIIAAINGELTCKILDTHNKQLLPANSKMAPIPIGDDVDLVSEGVVIHVIRRNVSGHDWSR